MIRVTVRGIGDRRGDRPLCCVDEIILRADNAVYAGIERGGRDGDDVTRRARRRKDDVAAHARRRRVLLRSSVGTRYDGARTHPYCRESTSAPDAFARQRNTRSARRW